MGPNGSGKSTLSYAIAGHPKYKVTSGSITLDGEDVLAMTRRRARPRRACSWPCSTRSRCPACRCRTSCAPPPPPCAARRRSCGTGSRRSRPRWTTLDIDPAFAERSVNEGFSGGEKKRHEILQLALLKPKIAILDETDSGLDVDALRVVSEGVNRYAEEVHGGILLITHYTRILRYIQPRLRPRVRRRPHRRIRRSRAGRRARRRTATSASPSRARRREDSDDGLGEPARHSTWTPSGRTFRS